MPVARHRLGCRWGDLGQTALRLFAGNARLFGEVPPEIGDSLQGIRSKVASQCSEVLSELNERLAEAQGEFESIASSRVPDEKTREEILQLLIRWLLHGKPDSRQKGLASSGDEELIIGSAV